MKLLLISTVLLATLAAGTALAEQSYTEISWATVWKRSRTMPPDTKVSVADVVYHWTRDVETIETLHLEYSGKYALEIVVVNQMPPKSRSMLAQCLKRIGGIGCRVTVLAHTGCHAMRYGAIAPNLPCLIVDDIKLYVFKNGSGRRG